MSDNTRDRTNEGRDPDNPGHEVVPPPQKPDPSDSAHVPGGATELGELDRAQQPPMGGKGKSDKAP